VCWSISMINVKSGRNGWWTVYAPRFGLACHSGGFQRTASGDSFARLELDVGNLHGAVM
jgi:hypothetical protein